MKGMTVVEVLVSVLIFSVVALGLGYAVVAGKNALLVSDIPTQLRGDLLFAISPLVRELRQTAPAKINLAEGASSNTVTFKIPNDNNADGVVVDSVGNIEWGGDIVYARNGSSQLTRTFGGTTSVIAPNIVTLLFTRINGENALIQVDITVSKTDGAGNLYQDSEQALVKMRN